MNARRQSLSLLNPSPKQEVVMILCVFPKGE